MILCRYFDEYGLDTLHDLHLKVSHPLEINDPFEFRPYFDENEKIDRDKIDQYFNDSKNLENEFNDFKKICPETAMSIDEFKVGIIKKFLEPKSIALLPVSLERTRKENSHKNSFLCFSGNVKKPADEILLWAHYGNKHQGVRIFFDIDKFIYKKGDFRPIDYRVDRIKLSITDLYIKNQENLVNMIDAIFSKSEVWSYEEEYRLLIKSKDCFSKIINGRKLDFIKVDVNAIKRVDIGVNANPKFREDILAVLSQEHFKHVEIYDAVMHENLYKLDYNKVNRNAM